MEKKQVRYILASDLNGPGLQRIFGAGAPEALARMEAFEAHIARSAGHSARITTALGTDISYQLAQQPTLHRRELNQAGIYTLPGACSLNPEIESVQGRIVVETIFHEFYTRPRHPLVLEVDGRIQSVSGPGPDRALLERALLRAGEGQFGYIIHLTHGVHPSARFTGDCFVEDMRAIGSNAIGLGLPWWLPGGGENHPDAVISTQSVWINNELVVDQGLIVLPAAMPIPE